MPDFKPSDFVTVGRIGAAYGIKGWVKLISFTDPLGNILQHSDFIIADANNLHTIEIVQSRSQGKGFVAHIKGCDDRDKTRDFTGKDLLVEKSELPGLEKNTFYWYQLEGLKVVTLGGDYLGNVHHLIETGANDVLIVRPTQDSIDDEERLIPYLTGRVIERVDLEQQLIEVDWEKDY